MTIVYKMKGDSNVLTGDRTLIHHSGIKIVDSSELVVVAIDKMFFVLKHRHFLLKFLQKNSRRFSKHLRSLNERWLFGFML